MKSLFSLFAVLSLLSATQAQTVKTNIPYTEKTDQRQVLDVYAPANAKNLPVGFLDSRRRLADGR